MIMLLQTTVTFAFTPSLADMKKGTPPPRIIRACCVLGEDLNLYGIPFSKINHIISPDDLNNHSYMGNRKEGNGIIYTQKGGFIDVGHLRDQADWTRYLFSLILLERENGEFVQKLKYEGGGKQLKFDATGLDSLDCLLLAGSITYNLSLWHELSTWFGASSVPMIPERYSSFSLEDAYSNLLGVYIGMEALKSNLPYDEAMTQVLKYTLDSLGAMPDEEGTQLAMQSVRDIWWTKSKRIPQSGVLMVRDIDVYTRVKPWLIPATDLSIIEPSYLMVPKKTTKGQLLDHYYTFSIDLNQKFPVEDIFPNHKDRIVTQNDFPILLNRVENEINGHKDVYSDTKKEIILPDKVEVRN